MATLMLTTGQLYETISGIDGEDRTFLIDDRPIRSKSLDYLQVARLIEDVLGITHSSVRAMSRSSLHDVLDSEHELIYRLNVKTQVSVFLTKSEKSEMSRIVVVE